jgi:hypothetical protein
MEISTVNSAIILFFNSDDFKNQQIIEEYFTTAELDYFLVSYYPLCYESENFKFLCLLGCFAYSTQSKKGGQLFHKYLSVLLLRHSYYNYFIDINPYSKSSKEDLDLFFKLINYITYLNVNIFYESIIITNQSNNTNVTNNQISDILNRTFSQKESKINFGFHDVLQIVLNKNLAPLIFSLNKYDRLGGELFLNNIISKNQWFLSPISFNPNFLLDLYNYEYSKYHFFKKLIESNEFDSVSYDIKYSQYLFFKNPHDTKSLKIKRTKSFVVIKTDRNYSILNHMINKAQKNLDGFFKSESHTEILVSFEFNNEFIQELVINSEMKLFLDSIPSDKFIDLDSLNNISLVSKSAIIHSGLIQCCK